MDPASPRFDPLVYFGNPAYLTYQHSHRKPSSLENPHPNLEPILYPATLLIFPTPTIYPLS